MRAILGLCICAVVGLLLGTCDKSPTDSTDLIPPAAIKTVWIADSGDTWANLCWIAPGDDSSTGKAAKYEIRVLSSVLTAQNWGAASVVPQSLIPLPAGRTEQLRLNNLASDECTCVGIRARDDAGNWSALSTVVCVKYRDTIPPWSISDLAADVRDDTLLILHWTAPGDDGLVGRVSGYEIRTASAEMSDSSWNLATIIPQSLLPAVPGQPEQLTFPWPSRDTALYIAMTALDHFGNSSHVSNNALAIRRSSFYLLWQTETATLPALQPVSAARLSDGDFVVVSNYKSGAGPSDVAVTKIDSLGNQDWQVVFGGEASEMAAAIASTADGGCVVGGTTWSFADSSGDPYLVRLSSGGSILWEKQVGVPGPDGLKDLAVDVAGNIAVVGSDHTVSQNPAGWVGLTDPNGSVLWRKYITASSWCPIEVLPAWATSTGVAFLGSGNIAVTSNSEYVDGGGHTRCNPPKEAVSLSIWSPSGDQISSGEYGFCEDGFAHANKIAASATGNVLAPWADYSSPTALTLSNIPTSSSSRWAVSVSGFPDFEPPLPCWLSFDNRALLFGHAYESEIWPGSAYTQAVVLIFGPDGTALHSISFGTQSVSEDPLAILPASDHDVYCIYASNRSIGYVIGIAKLRIAY